MKKTSFYNRATNILLFSAMAMLMVGSVSGFVMSTFHMTLLSLSAAQVFCVCVLCALALVAIAQFTQLLSNK